MSIYESIREAKNEKGADRKTLSLLMSEICIDGKPVSDSEAIKILNSLRKTSKETYGLYIDKGKLSAAHDERMYCELIMKFLPRPATLNQILEIMKDMDLPKEIKSMGPLMKACKAKYQIVDGNMVKSALLG